MTTLPRRRFLQLTALGSAATGVALLEPEPVRRYVAKEFPRTWLEPMTTPTTAGVARTEPWTSQELIELPDKGTTYADCWQPLATRPDGSIRIAFRPLQGVVQVKA